MHPVGAAPAAHGNAADGLADIAKATAELHNGKFLKHEIQYEE